MVTDGVDNVAAVGRARAAVRPRDAVVAVTHRCNAQCVMCNIWKSRASDALEPDHMRKLPPGLRTVNLSGGEPFLRKDLPDFVREVRAACPKAQITISTNAFLADRIARAMDEIRRIDPAIHLAISLDGLGEAHNRIRGDAGAFDAAMKLVQSLSDSGFAGLRLGMTVSNANLDQVLDVAEFAARHGLELGIVAAQCARTHLGVQDLPATSAPAWLAGAFAKLIAPWLRSWRCKQWLRAHFAYHTYRYLIDQPWRVKCRAGQDFFFLQADGTVYSCSVAGVAMGNIIRDDWAAIWNGAASAEARQAAVGCQENCWMICTARSEYRRKALGVLGWIVAQKVRAHLRVLRLPGTRGARR